MLNCDNDYVFSLNGHPPEPTHKNVTIIKEGQQRLSRFGFNTHGNVISVPNPGGRNVTMIAALDNMGGIGKNNDIPWKISPDMQQFKRLTVGYPIIMGRKTFESMGNKPLRCRTNVVLSRDISKVIGLNDDFENVIACGYLQNALDCLSADQVFIIGGSEIYKESLRLNLVDDMILTRIMHNAECDTFFPEFDSKDWLPPAFSTHALSGGVTMRYEYWRKIQPETLPLKEDHGSESATA